MCTHVHTHIFIPICIYIHINKNKKLKKKKKEKKRCRKRRVWAKRKNRVDKANSNTLRSSFSCSNRVNEKTADVKI